MFNEPLSKNSKRLVASLIAALGRDGKRSGATRAARRVSCRVFARYVQGNEKRDVSSIDEVTFGMVRRFSDYLLQRNSPGTVKNHLCNLRATFAGSRKKRKLAFHKDLTNAALGIPERTRIGCRIPPSAEYFQSCNAKVRSICVGSSIALETSLGLGTRIQEGVRCVGSLGTWRAELKEKGQCQVIFGTKGGRSRIVRPIDLEFAIEVVERALVVTRQNGGVLVPGKDLASANRRLSRVARQCGFKGVHSPHSLRYAFAVKQFDGYLARGFSHSEARALVAMDLGHGDGRGRWAWSVYLRSRHELLDQHQTQADSNDDEE